MSRREVKVHVGVALQPPIFLGFVRVEIVTNHVKLRIFGIGSDEFVHKVENPPPPRSLRPLHPTAQAHTPSQDTAKAPHDPSSAMEMNPAQTHNQAFLQTAFTHPSGDYYFDKCRPISAQISILK